MPRAGESVWDRRGFLLAGGAAVLAGGARGDGPVPPPAAVPPQVTRRAYRGTALTLPLLGFGLMRTPWRVLARGLARRAMAVGLNSFDTGFNYQQGYGERFLGDIREMFPRESYLVTDKLPHFALSGADDLERMFNEQLARTRAGYFDFYLLHWLSEAHWPHARKLKALAFIRRKQKEGLVRRIGFSYHGGVETLREIAGAEPWDLALIQLTLKNWRTTGRLLFDTLAARRIPIAVMSPLGGGQFATLPESAREILREAAPNRSIASWTFRFFGSMPEIAITLSGMTRFAHLEDNIRTFTNFQPLSSAERQALDAALPFV